jgi:hypothetical protein
MGYPGWRNTSRADEAIENQAFDRPTNQGCPHISSCYEMWDPQPFASHSLTNHSGRFWRMRSTRAFAVRGCGLHFASSTRPPVQRPQSVRSAAMGSMEAARRAGMMAAIRPETASKAQTERIVRWSCRAALIPQSFRSGRAPAANRALRRCRPGAGIHSRSTRPSPTDPAGRIRNCN